MLFGHLSADRFFIFFFLPRPGGDALPLRRILVRVGNVPAASPLCTIVKSGGYGGRKRCGEEYFASCFCPFLAILCFRGNVEVVFRYLNRLSDYLFTAARFSNHSEGAKEEIYVKQRP